MSRAPVCPDMQETPLEGAGKSLDLVDIEQDAGSGGPSAALAREPSAISPRLIPVPDSHTLSIQLLPVPSSGDTRQVSASCDRNCVLSQVPALDTANYDQLSVRQWHELRKRREYRK